MGLSIERLEPRILLSAFTELVSLASDGSQGDDWSHVPCISADGRYTAFESNADNFVAGDTNNAPDVFVYDRGADTIERVSVASDGTQANGSSYRPALSANGRWVAFHSAADNLVAGDTNGTEDVFVYDRQTGSVERVSVASDGTEGDDSSIGASVSADGRYVAFESWAGNLVSHDTNGARDVFVYDRQCDAVERVSVASDGTQGDSWSWEPDISADGRHVAFSSYAGNLVPDDGNGLADIFMYDRQTGMVERVSVAFDGTESNGSSSGSAISADGRFVAFESSAGNLVPGDSNGGLDIFVYDRDADSIERVSLAADGTQANSWSWEPAISAHGRYVAFRSSADNLVPGDTNGVGDVFIYDRQPDSPERVSVASGGAEANDWSYMPAVSADGRHVVFHSAADNLVPGDGNDAWDVFVRDRGPAELMWGLNPNNGVFVREGINDSYRAGTDWLRVPGRLAQVSVGEASVWGINPNGGIFCREGIARTDLTGRGWERATGTLSQVSVGEMGVVWGVNAAGGIFVREGVTEGEPAGTGWSRVWGRLAYVNAGEGCVWGINPNGGIFVREGIDAANPAGTGWTQVPGTLAQVSVGGMGLVWGLNDAGGIFVREGVVEGNLPGTAWTRVAGRLGQLSAGVGALWGVNANGGIFYRTGVSAGTPKGTGWARCRGRLEQVSIGVAEVLSTTTSTALAETANVEGTISSGSLRAGMRSPRAFDSDLLESPDTLERLGIADAEADGELW